MSEENTAHIHNHQNMERLIKHGHIQKSQLSLQPDVLFKFKHQLQLRFVEKLT